MDINNVPQDNSKTYANMKKAIYASDENGKLKSVGSSGWNVEEIVTKQALEDIQNSIDKSYTKVLEGEKSPLYYHMYAARMDIVVLSQSTGFFKWSIKRDFKPSVFKKISQKRLLKYCDALGITPQEIKILPKRDSDE